VPNLASQRRQPPTRNRRPRARSLKGVIRYAKIHGTKHRPWLTTLLARRPTKVAAIALANKMARMAWAMMARGERVCRVPVVCSATLRCSRPPLEGRVPMDWCVLFRVGGQHSGHREDEA
jgi:hypothetical protein